MRPGMQQLRTDRQECRVSGQQQGLSSSSNGVTRQRTRHHCHHCKNLAAYMLLLLILQLLWERTAAAAAQPCVACDDCITSSCLRICVPSCKGLATSDASSLSRDQCKHKGHEAASDVATAACKLSQEICKTSSKMPAQFQSMGTVSGSQCAAMANAACQKVASSATYSPCGVNQYFGHRTCSGRQFTDIYKHKVGELCLLAMGKFG